MVLEPRSDVTVANKVLFKVLWGFQLGKILSINAQIGNMTFILTFLL